MTKQIALFSWLVLFPVGFAGGCAENGIARSGCMATAVGNTSVRLEDLPVVNGCSQSGNYVSTRPF